MIVSKEKASKLESYTDNTQPKTQIGKTYQTKAGETIKTGNSTTEVKSTSRNKKKSGLPIFK